jgi:hypothetical protein
MVFVILVLVSPVVYKRAAVVKVFTQAHRILNKQQEHEAVILCPYA